MFKKWIISLLAVAGFQAVAVDADYSGEYRLRTNTGMMTDDFSSVGSSLQDQLNIRSKISGSYRPSESLEANTSVYMNIGSGLEGMNFLSYGDWMMTDELMLRVGRTTYQIAQGQVIGTNDYENEPVIFNGVFLTHSSESFGADLAYVTTGGYADEKEDEGAEDNAPAVVVSIDARSFPEWIKTANLHLIAQANELNKARFGVTVSGGSMGVGYMLTAATSSLADTSGNLDSVLIDGALGYTHEWDSSSAKVYAGYHKDGANYDAHLYNKHMFAGKLDMASWGGGLSYATLGVSYKINADNKVGVKGLYFMEAQEDAAVKKDDMEVDVYYKASLDSAVAFKVWAGMLMSGDDMTSKAEAALTMKF